MKTVLKTLATLAAAIALTLVVVTAMTDPSLTALAVAAFTGVNVGQIVSWIWL